MPDGSREVELLAEAVGKIVLDALEGIGEEEADELPMEEEADTEGVTLLGPVETGVEELPAEEDADELPTDEDVDELSIDEVAEGEAVEDGVTMLGLEG